MNISRKNVIGIWKLISMESQTVDGEVLEKFNWIGRLRYDDKGYMSVQLMDSNRQPLEDWESSEELKKAFEGYNAYYGTYDVDHEEGSVTHHLEGSLFPNWTNIDLKRLFKLFDNRLELITTPRQENDTEVVWRLIWERVD
ncbi:MAG: lipocalin-like domain-containing protein [Promethearchaeota archaeon]